MLAKALVGLMKKRDYISHGEKLFEVLLSCEKMACA